MLKLFLYINSLYHCLYIKSKELIGVYGNVKIILIY
jgi:hypothetical protein